MAAQRGRDMLIKIENDQNVFVTIAGLRSKSLKFGAKTIDITDSGSDDAWRELLPGAGIKSVEISGAGIFRDGASDALMRSSFFNQTSETYEIVIPDFGTITGAFLISVLNYAGSYQGEASYELVLVSAGKPVFAAL